MLITLCTYEPSSTRTEDDVTGILGTVYRLRVGWDSAVGRVIRYGLDGPGIESRSGRDFPQLTGPGAYPVSYTMGTGFSRGGKAAGLWR